MKCVENWYLNIRSGRVKMVTVFEGQDLCKGSSWTFFPKLWQNIMIYLPYNDMNNFYTRLTLKVFLTTQLSRNYFSKANMITYWKKISSCINVQIEGGVKVRILPYELLKIQLPWLIIYILCFRLFRFAVFLKIIHL